MSEKKQKKKVESESKQEKANRIISEAIAKAKERGERNIPRVMSPENFPSVSAEGREEKKGRKIKCKPKDKESKKTKTGSSSKIKDKTKIGKLIITLGKKQKRKNESSDEMSDTKQTPQRSFKDEDSQKRRSNRQVKRKKYAEEGEGKQSEEEAKVSVKIKKSSAPLPAEQPLQLFVVRKNPELCCGVSCKGNSLLQIPSDGVLLLLFLAGLAALTYLGLDLTPIEANGNIPIDFSWLSIRASVVVFESCPYDFSKFQDLFKRMASELRINPEEVPEQQHELTDILQPPPSSRIALPINPALLEPAKAIWQTPAASLPTCKRADRKYFIPSKGSEFPFTHPAPNSLVVDAVNQKNKHQYPRSAPVDKDSLSSTSDQCNYEGKFHGLRGRKDIFVERGFLKKGAVQKMKEFEVFEVVLAEKNLWVGLQENPSEEDAAIVDKILSSRIVKKEISAGMTMEEEEFFVKYKNYSYLHCEWATEQQLLKDKRIQQKIKRFKLRQAQRAHFFADMEEEPFNPDYVEVDRVLEVSFCEDKDTGEPVIYYLVKWCSLPYEDSTWELKEDVDQAKIEEFEQLQASRPDSRRLDRPPPNSWKKLEQSREYKNGNQLREYQLEGLNWLLFNWYNRRNCILADEMGLGKTIQSITFLYEILLTGIRGPFLIIAPLSTITNWEREFRTWTDLNVVVYHGSMVSRQMIQQYEMYFRDSQGRIIRGTYRFQAIITTFEMILGGCPELNAIEWRCVIIDEAHRLKNKNCKLLEGLKLMNLVQKLQAILKPMMLRRLKEDVEKKLAPKEETIIEVELTNIQKKYYRAILEKNFAFLSKGAGQANVPNLVNTMMELRKCCNHPYLIKGAEEKILGEFRETYIPTAPDFHLQAMIQSAGKLVLIDKLLPKMKAGGHKVLIFSQMVRCLDILEDYLIHKRYLYERIDGRVRGNLRQAAIDRFSKPDSDRFVFLLCTRAGGLGINLTAADTCIIFDSDWNPQNDLQAQARCHRIGQNKAVKVYRLITRNSYEREMFDRASLKLGLDKAVLQSMSGRENSVGGIQQLSKKEIEDLLRRGAYGAIMDEEDEGSKFCEEDIDQILQRRTKTITIESEGRGSTFAKASFVASGNRTDISLDDPNFWQKWAKKAEIDIDAISGRNSLVIDTPRIRKQTRPFSATKDELAELSEAESEGDDKPKLRRPCDRSSGYGRTECFRVEKNLLVYGWGRWREILSHGRFKRQLNEQDVEIICRALLAYCLVHYRGDEKIKSFIWDLITPTEDGQTRELQNHLGLSAPVPRGRKGKKVKTQASTFDIHKAEWLRKYNPEHLLQDEGYKKHIKHHCNKVLLRVRMLYYLKQEVIGNECQKVFDGVDASEVDVWVPEPEHSEVPAEWWDADADKSLLIGVFKHGYEKYNTIRADPALCFLERVGKPDEKAVAAEQRANDYIDGDVEDPEYKPAPAMFKDDMEDDASSPGDLVIADGDGQMMEGDKIYWPTQSALTTRLRRLITAYQRTSKNRQAQQIQPTFPVQATVMQPPYEEAALNPKIAAKIERQQRWTRREEADFYRVVSTFGVVFDPDGGRFDWTKFRAMARLHKKTDESLEKYLYAFMSMCRRVCRLPSKEELVDPTIFIQPITEERASRTLYRIELLRKVREQALRHPQLFERLKLCQPNPDLPVWWECGTHDRDLLIGAAKHGVSRTDYHILRDPELSFMSAQRNYSQNKVALSRTSTPLLHQYQMALSASPLAPQSRLLDTKGNALEDTKVKNENLKEDPQSSEEESMSTEETRTMMKSEPLSPKNGTPLQTTDHKPGVKTETDRRMVAARTEPLTPNPASKKQRVNKRGFSPPAATTPSLSSHSALKAEQRAAAAGQVPSSEGSAAASSSGDVGWHASRTSFPYSSPRIHFVLSQFENLCSKSGAILAE
ncbi:Chromodomain-helicase-DNA-binding protein 9 [Chelonia mydas]|uniref:Chromodomain-helicase-DNA-binding protein 9 n=1 Tax=Chelonia mydas TaxID=8469 RepID=M7BZJ7_CHEMY|nr:Chromodomain-helicase-DNA-binding protein 9 [Chelonia mydas]